MRQVLSCLASRHRLSVPAVLLAGLFWACGAAPSPETSVIDPADEPTAGEVAATSDSTTEEASNCAGLDQLGCIDSPDCTLRQLEDKSYACTDPQSDCEIGFLQRGGRRDDCAEGCDYSPARCYCSPDVTCVCGGGPPALCQAAG